MKFSCRLFQYHGIIHYQVVPHKDILSRLKYDIVDKGRINVVYADAHTPATFICPIKDRPRLIAPAFHWHVHQYRQTIDYLDGNKKSGKNSNVWR